MTEPDNRPRILATLPSGGSAHVAAEQSWLALASRGKTVVIPNLTLGPAATFNHNQGWATALKYQEAGIIDYWLLQHADVEVQTHGFADLMVEEMRRVGAAVLSVVLPIKDQRGQSSTAIETTNFWCPRKLGMHEVWALPETFCRADVRDQPDDMPGGGLLANTGLMLVDLRRPEFHQVRNADGDLTFFFTLIDRVFRTPDNIVATFASEDWNFARTCHVHGLPVYVTRKIDCIHHGGHGWSNQPPTPAAAPDPYYPYG